MGNGFDRAQRDYDRQTPYDNDLGEKECPTCDTAGEILNPDPTLWQTIKAFLGIETFITCPECEGEGFVQKTSTDIENEDGDRADQLRDEDIARDMEWSRDEKGE